MTKVDFYNLTDGELLARDHFACRLAEQAFRAGTRVYLHTRDAAHSAELDTLLWTFRDSSFVPHNLLGSGSAVNTVEIGHGEQCGDHNGVLINLSDSIPAFFSRFEEVKEILVDDEDHKARGREHWRFYRDHGYPLKHNTERQKILTR